MTDVAYDTPKLMGMNIPVLKSNTIYCSIIFAYRTESAFIKFLYEVNWCENIFMATKARFLPNTPTQNRPPDSKLQIPVKRGLRRTPP
jgi:hypothetical protein